MVLCTERSLVKHEGQGLHVRPLRCKCWRCSHCVNGKKRDLWHKANNGKPDMFITLTMRKGYKLTPEEQAVEFVKGWRMLRQFIERRLGRKGITFLAVFENHKSGWPHLHILLRSPYIDHRLIRGWWKSRFQSTQIDVRRVKSQRQRASYVTKYVAKAPEGFGSCKRYWCSKDWDPPKKPDDMAGNGEFAWWEVISMRPDSVARVAYNEGARLTWQGDLLVITGWHHADRSRWGFQ